MKSYIIVAKSKKLVEEIATRKKARRIARKKYSKQYREEKSYIIVSGKTLAEALSLYQKEKMQVADKKKSPTKQVAKKKQVASKKKPASMLEAAKQEEEKQVARMNARNSKD